MALTAARDPSRPRTMQKMLGELRLRTTDSGTARLVLGNFQAALKCAPRSQPMMKLSFPAGGTALGEGMDGQNDLLFEWATKGGV